MSTESSEQTAPDDLPPSGGQSSGGQPAEGFPAHLEGLWTSLEALLIAFDEVLDRLDPPRIPEFAARLQPLSEELGRAIAECEARPEVKAGDDAVAGKLLRGASQVHSSAQRFEAAGGGGPHAILKAFQALRPMTRGREILFELAGSFAPISRYFLDPGFRDRPGLMERLRSAGGQSSGSAKQSGPERGLSVYENSFGKRGGYSLFVPEDYTPRRKWPLVVAMHGGSGHGADFLWNWLPTARAMGFILVSPTSRGRTWSLRNPGLDAANLNHMLSRVSGTYKVDHDRLLLTGISDGGTYACLLSVVHQSPFTHYAPVAAAVHVLMNQAGVIEAPVAGKKYYQVHGGKDWMFPVDKARQVARALETAGADVTYREIEDLSHNYPGDENARIIEWFSPGLESE